VSDDTTLHSWGKGVFIDPEHVGSTVQGRLSATTWNTKTDGKRARVDATMRLSDCSRVIEWDFGAYDMEDGGMARSQEQLAKLDRFISLAQEFRKQYEAACKKAIKAVST
jgi:hypothetical protein